MSCKRAGASINLWRIYRYPGFRVEASKVTVGIKMCDIKDFPGFGCFSFLQPRVSYFTYFSLIVDQRL